MTHSALLSRLHELNAKLDSVMEFARREDEGPDTYAGTGAKIGAGIGAVNGAFAGALLPERARRANALIGAMKYNSPGVSKYRNVLGRLAQGGAKVRIGGGLIGAASGAVAPALIGAGIGALIKRRDERR